MIYSLTTNPDLSCTLTIYNTDGATSIFLTKYMAVQLAHKLNPSGQKPSLSEQFAPEMVLDDL